LDGQLQISERKDYPWSKVPFCPKIEDYQRQIVFCQQSTCMLQQMSQSCAQGKNCTVAQKRESCAPQHHNFLGGGNQKYSHHWYYVVARVYLSVFTLVYFLSSIILCCHHSAAR